MATTLARKVALNTAALVSGRVLVVIGGIASVTLASRYLSLNQYGAMVTAVAFVGILEIVTDLGVYTMAAREIAREPARERHILGNVLGLSLSLAVVVAATGLLLLQVVYPGAGHELVRRAGALLLLGMLAAPLSGTARAHFVARQQAWLSALGEVASVATTIVVIALAVTLDWGFTPVVAAYPIGRAVQTTVFTALIRPDVRLSFSIDPRYWRRMLAISLPLGAAMIINFVYFRLDALLLSILRSAADVALYGLAYKVVEAMIVVPSYFMTTLFPEIARMDRRSEQLRNVMGQALAIMEMIALPVLVLTVVFADEAVTLVGGAKFHDAAGALQLLAIGLAVSFPAGVYGHALVAMGRQAALLRTTGVALVVNAALNLLLIPLLGIYGAAASVAVSESLALAVMWRMYVAAAPPPAGFPWARMALAGCSLLVALAIKAALPLQGASLVAAGSAAALASYAGALVLLRAVPEAVHTQLLGPLLRPRRT